MRGRTNVSADGIILNANVETYKVANGEDIVAGNFVEYFSVLSGGVSGAISPSDYSKIFRLSNGEFMLIANNEYAVVGVSSNDEYNVITKGTIGTDIDSDILNSNTILNKVYVGNDTVACITASVSSTNLVMKVTYLSYDRTLEKVNIATENQTLTTSANYYDSSNYPISLIPSPNLTNFKLVFMYSRGSSSYDHYFGIADVKVANNKLSAPTNIATSRIASSQSTYNNKICSLVRINTNEFYFYLGYKNSVNWYCKHIRVSNNAITMSSQEIDSQYMALDSEAVDGYIPFIQYTVSGAIKIRYGFVDPTNTTPLVNWFSVIDTSINSSRVNLQLIRKVGKIEYYAVHCHTSSNVSDISIFEIDRVNKTVVANQPSRINSRYNYVSFAILYVSDSEIYMCATGMDETGTQAFGRFELVNNQMLNTYSESICVRNITTQNYIKGVAKTTASSGSAIDVYVPIV